MSALAQTYSSPIPTVLPLSSEHKADPGAIFGPNSKVTHTGTDGIVYEVGARLGFQDPQEGQTMQVMTWDDGNDVHVSWGFYENTPGSTPSINFPNVLVSNPAEQGSFRFSVAPSDGGPDPDIVLGYDPSGQLYINLVYIDNGQIIYRAMRWDYAGTRSFDQTAMRIPLGDSRFTHSYPNIDANSYGLTAVTWQQTFTDVVNITVASTSAYFPTYTFAQTITFGRTVLAAGDITGNFRPCYKEPLTGTYGVPVLDPPTGLFEQTLHPDVAISNAKEDQAVISSTFVRHYVDGRGLFSIFNKVAVVQTAYDQCGKVSEPNPGLVTLRVTDRYEWDYSTNDLIGTPRIASSAFGPGSGFDTDVEVAIDRTRTDCGPTQYAIWNFGKDQGAFRPEYTLVSPAGPGLGEPNLLYSVEPAIAYSLLDNRNVPTLGIRNSYSISWTGGPGYGPNSRGSDIWAVSLIGGSFGNGASGPLAQAPQYSRVNLQGKETQRSASIAGRFFRTPSAFLRGTGTSASGQDPDKANPILAPFVHLFFDANDQLLGFRRSQNAPGTAALRGTAPAPLLQAYPNPSDGAVRLQLALHPDERVRSIQVFDAMGRAVADLAIPKPGAEAVEWQPAATLPSGVYTVRTVTSERTASVGISRK